MYFVAISDFLALHNGVLIIIITILQSLGHTTLCLSLLSLLSLCSTNDGRYQTSSTTLHKNFGQPYQSELILVLNGFLPLCGQSLYVPYAVTRGILATLSTTKEQVAPQRNSFLLGMSPMKKILSLLRVWKSASL